MIQTNKNWVLLEEKQLIDRFKEPYIVNYPSLILVLLVYIITILILVLIIKKIWVAI